MNDLFEATEFKQAGYVKILILGCYSYHLLTVFMRLSHFFLAAIEALHEAMSVCPLVRLLLRPLSVQQSLRSLVRSSIRASSKIH